VVPLDDTSCTYKKKLYALNTVYLLATTTQTGRKGTGETERLYIIGNKYRIVSSLLRIFSL